jgi:integrase
MRLASKAHDIFSEIRRLKTKSTTLENRKRKAMTEANETLQSHLTDEKIRELVDREMKETLNYEFELRVNRERPWQDNELEKHLASRQRIASDIREQAAHADYRGVKNLVSGILEQEGIKVSEKSTDYKKLCDALMKGIAKAYDEAGSIDFSPLASKLSEAEAGKTVVVTQQPAAPSRKSPTITEAVEKYIKTKTESGEWKVTSVKDLAPQLRQFAEMVSNGKKLPTHEITRDHMRKYREELVKLPSLRYRCHYKGKSKAQLLKMDIPENHRLKPKSIKTRFDNVRSFINWAELEGYVDKAKPLNVALAFKKNTLKAKQAKRRAFTSDELKALFHSAPYQGTATGKQKFTKAWQFWAPLIALFTGARVEEICQLHLDDIREIDGVPCIDINNEGDKELKTAAGKRIVPVHPFLIKLGLLERVKTLRSKGEQHLFSRKTLSKREGNVSANVTQWFTRFRRDCGVGAGEGEVSNVTFHSFRHTFITWAKLHDIDRRKLKEVVGHEKGEFDDITAIYEGSYPASTLFRDVIQPVDWDREITLDALVPHGKQWIKSR